MYFKLVDETTKFSSETDEVFDFTMNFFQFFPCGLLFAKKNTKQFVFGKLKNWQLDQNLYDLNRVMKIYEIWIKVWLGVWLWLWISKNLLFHEVCSLQCHKQEYETSCFQVIWKICHRKKNIVALWIVWNFRKFLLDIDKAFNVGSKFFEFYISSGLLYNAVNKNIKLFDFRKFKKFVIC